MRGSRTILIVDNDSALRRSLAEQLELHAEFSSLECEAGAAAMDLVRHHPLDAALLAAALPDIGGRDLCRQMRAAGASVPIVILADGDSMAEAELALEAGANDYVAKPFRVSVLLSKLRAHMRRTEVNGEEVLTIGPYAFRPGAKLLTELGGGKNVRLTDKEAAILIFLYRAGRAIGRERLLGEVWGYNAGVTTHTLETHVYRLRRKIEREPSRAEILVTEAGGYRLLP